MDLSINLKNKKKNQNWYSNPYPKIFSCILNYLFRSLQEICKIPKKLKAQTQT